MAAEEQRDKRGRKKSKRGRSRGRDKEQEQEEGEGRAGEGGGTRGTGRRSSNRKWGGSDDSGLAACRLYSWDGALTCALRVAWSTASCLLSNTRPQIRATRKGSRRGNSHAGHFQEGLWEDTSIGKQGREGELCCSPNRDFSRSREMLWDWNGPLESSPAEAQRQVFRASVNQSLARIALRRGMTLGEVASMLGEQLLGGTCPLGSAATPRGGGTVSVHPGRGPPVWTPQCL